MSAYYKGVPIKTITAVQPAQQADWDQDLDATLAHASYHQGAQGWTMTVGNDIMAACEKTGKIASRRCTTPLTVSVLSSNVAQTITFNVFVTEFSGMVTIGFEQVGITPNQTCPGLSNGVAGLKLLPTGCCPAATTYFAVPYTMNSVLCTGSLTISTGGVLTFAPTPSNANFTQSQAMAFTPFTVTYDRLSY
jgi:hypothetical protein